MPIIIPDSDSSGLGADAPSAPDIPHFRAPFSLNNGTAASVVEQDTLDEVMSCVTAVVACPQGAWNTNPAFGTPSQLFAQAPLNPAVITAAIAQWEPRAVTAATEYPDALSDAVRNVQISVSTPGSDQ